ncbi:Cysteine-rich secretory protein [Gracilaria domingensis]|nr:Cysteine-rich secretory protein [Gracilaria domingensis]
MLCMHLMFSVSASEISQNRMCVLDENGDHGCDKGSKVSLNQFGRKLEQCDQEDNRCWCMKAIAYTNEVRKRNGKKKMLKPGPMAQLHNANRYATTLASIGTLKHQDLASATNEVGCNRRIGGENIAYNYEKRDVAFSCVRQWESSQGHLENMLRDNFDEVVVGFFKAQNGQVYCVQTFSVVAKSSSHGNGNDPQCESVAQGIPDKAIENSSNAKDDDKSQSTDSKIISLTEATVDGGNMNSDDEEIAQEAQEHSPNSEYGEKENHDDAPSGIIDNGIENEEALIENEGQDSSQRGDRRNPDVDSEAIDYDNEDSRVDEMDVVEGPEGFVQIPTKNSANNDFAVSVDEDHPSYEHAEDYQSGLNAGHPLFVGKEDSSEGEELEQPGGNDQETDETARASGDHSSHEVDDQRPQGPENEHEDFADEPMQKGITNSEREEKEVHIGNRACRCLELGKRCWHSLEEQTDKLCTAFVPTNRQPTACKLKCCSHCLTRHKTRRCTNKVVKRLCQKMRKNIESKM